METQKWVNLFILVAATIVYIFLSHLSLATWEFFHLKTFNWTLQPQYLLSFALTLGIAVFVRFNETSNGFLNEVVQELLRVTWPTRQETVASAGVVLVLIVIAAVLISGIDLFWTKVIKGAVGLK